MVKIECKQWNIKPFCKQITNPNCVLWMNRVIFCVLCSSWVVVMLWLASGDLIFNWLCQVYPDEVEYTGLAYMVCGCSCASASDDPSRSVPLIMAGMGHVFSLILYPQNYDTGLLYVVVIVCIAILPACRILTFVEVITRGHNINPSYMMATWWMA